MQTFLPYKDFNSCSSVLDYKRLGKQRVEAKQIIDLLESDKKNRWTEHPAVRMWSNNVDVLKVYYNCILLEWINRGYNNSMKFYNVCTYNLVYPIWFNDNRIYISHRSNLLRKYKEHYIKYEWNVSDNLPYYWPVSVKNNMWNNEIENLYLNNYANANINPQIS